MAPPPRVQRWVESAAGAELTAVTALPQSGATGPWRLTLSRGGVSRAWVLHLGDPADTASVRGFATQAAALELAGRHGVAVPEIVASDLDGAATGSLALVTTALPGSSRIPAVLVPARERAFGAAIAAIHAVRAEPSAALPRRGSPLAGADFDGGRVPRATAELIAAARRVLAGRQAPQEPQVLVHGDLWRGNTLWEGEEHVATLDWDFAGVGPAGIDLGSVRCDVAMMDGVEAADLVVEGYRAAGGVPGDLPWWDAVAALSSPADLRAWLPNFHAHGRTDLDLPTVTARRDAFLAAALDRLA